MIYGFITVLHCTTDLLELSFFSHRDAGLLSYIEKRGHRENNVTGAKEMPQNCLGWRGLTWLHSMIILNMPLGLNANSLTCWSCKTPYGDGPDPSKPPGPKSMLPFTQQWGSDLKAPVSRLSLDNSTADHQWHKQSSFSPPGFTSMVYTLNGVHL